MMARPTKAEVIERLQKALEKIPVLKQLRDYPPEFKKWRRDTRVALEKTFGEDDSHVDDFRDVSFFHYTRGLESAEAVLESMLDEV